MGLASWDFRCRSCGSAFVHMYEAPRPTTTPCIRDGCDGTAGWTSCVPNTIHPTHSGRKYGEFDPQYGLVVEDYAHRQRLLKERGWDELPPADLDEVRHETIAGENRSPDGDTSSVLKGDSVEEIEKSINKDMVDRRLTGERERRPMLESWVEL